MMIIQSVNQTDLQPKPQDHRITNELWFGAVLLEMHNSTTIACDFTLQASSS